MSKIEAGTSEKSIILKSEPHAISLANYTVAYSRRGDEEDTLIIRELSKRSSFDHFGVKGFAELERLLYTILGLLKSQLTVLAQRTRFGEGRRISILLNNLQINEEITSNYSPFQNKWDFLQKYL